MNVKNIISTSFRVGMIQPSSRQKRRYCTAKRTCLFQRIVLAYLLVILIHSLSDIGQGAAPCCDSCNLEKDFKVGHAHCHSYPNVDPTNFVIEESCLRRPWNWYTNCLHFCGPSTNLERKRNMCMVPFDAANLAAKSLSLCHRKAKF
jgi:hypothetical protein